MSLLYLGSAWVLGILLGERFQPPWGLLAGLAAPLFLGGLVLRRRWRAGVGGIYLALLLLGMLRFQAHFPQVDEASLQFYNGSGEVGLRGIVTSDPEPRERAIYLRLGATEIKVNGEWREVEGTALVYAPLYPDLALPGKGGRDFPYYRYGDLLQVEGELEAPPRLPGFDYRDYLARQGIHSLIPRPRGIALLASDRGLAPLEWIYRLRGSLSRSLSQALPEPQGSLARGILLGQRASIPEDLREDFNRTGTTHIIAISGYNLTIVMGLLVAAAAWLLGRRRPLYLLLALGAIWGYSLLTGMPASVVRAAIMGSLWLLADLLGRPGAAGPALILAAAIMAGLNPLVLGDVAFQLSFAAMAGLIYLAPPLGRWGRRAWQRVCGGLAPPSRMEGLGNLMIDGVAVTLGAILATAPIIAHNFHRLSLVGLPATFLALPALPGIIVLSALTGGLGLFLPGAAQVVGWAAWLFLTYMIKVVESFASLPLASWDVLGVSAPMVWAYYALLAGLVWLGGHRHLVPTLKRLAGPLGRLPGRKLALALLPVAALIWVAALTLPDRSLHVYFLDVGQGDGILITTPEGQAILIDGGPGEGGLAQHLGQRLPFWDRSLDLMVLTHYHEDHVGGQVEVLRRYRVGRVLDVGWGEAGPSYGEWRKLVKEKGIEYLPAQVGQVITLGEGLRLEVLHPPSPRLKATGEDVDNNSAVLRLVAGQVSFLFTGDLQEEGEAYLVERGMALRSTVLKVGHHGSATSTSPRLLEAIDPQVAVISVGADNPFGHPSPEVMERLRERLGRDRVFLTSERGTIELITDGEGLWVETER